MKQKKEKNKKSWKTKYINDFDPTLSKDLRIFINAIGGTKLGKLCGISKANVTHWLNNRSPIPYKHYRKIVEYSKDKTSMDLEE